MNNYKKCRDYQPVLWDYPNDCPKGWSTAEKKKALWILIPVSGANEYKLFNLWANSFIYQSDYGLEDKELEWKEAGQKYHVFTGAKREKSMCGEIWIIETTANGYMIKDQRTNLYLESNQINYNEGRKYVYTQKNPGHPKGCKYWKFEAEEDQA